jgi:hypothetical protein
MKRGFVTLFAAAVTLSACGDVNTYRPQVSSSPAKGKYDKDVAKCISEGKEKHQRAVDAYTSGGNSLWAGAFGLAGSAVGSQVGSADYNKSTYDFINECLEAKGYRLVR